MSTPLADRSQPGWVFSKIEQPKVSYLPAHFSARITAEDAVSKLQNPEASMCAVVDVERSRPVVAGCHDEQQHAFGILHPVNDHTLSSGQKTGNDIRYILFRLHLQ